MTWAIILIFRRGSPIRAHNRLNVADRPRTSRTAHAVDQRGSTADLLFTPAELVAYCSTFTSLEPGDVILTGAPGRTPAAGKILEPGQRLVTAIEGIGATINVTGADSLPDNRGTRQ